MDCVRKVSLFSGLLLGLFSIFLGTLAGDFISYTVGAVMLTAVTVYSFLAKSSERSLMILLILISLSLRYIPIIKFNQPLYEDPVFDMATAKEFQKNGTVGVLPDAPVRNLREYSGFPLVHALAISISAATGLSLFDVFTYFPPLLDLASILFVYLLARRVFESSRIAALSGLIYATFSLNMLWLGTQIIRQSMAYPLALMAVYLFIRGSKTDRKMLGLSLFSFGVLPVAHHLTSMEIFYILGFTLVLAAFLEYGKDIRFLFWKKNKNIKSQTREDRFSFHLTLWLFLGASMFLYWITYARDVILPLFSARFFTILFSIISMREAGGLPMYVGSVTQSMNMFNILSYARLLFLLVTSLYGFFVLTRERNRYKSFLYGFFLAPLPLLFVDIFIQHLTDMRHALFLLIPVFLLTAEVISRFDKDRLRRKIIFAVCLLIVIVPAPFMLFATLDPAPTYVYDKNSPFRFDLPQKRAFRNEFVLSGTSYIAQPANVTLIADYYATFGLFFYYDPYKVLPFGRVIITHAQDTTPQDIVVIDMEIYNERYMPLFLRHNLTIVVEDINNLQSTANCIYSNGELISWKIQLPSIARENGGK
jgi:hypothetical protein